MARIVQSLTQPAKNYDQQIQQSFVRDVDSIVQKFSPEQLNRAIALRDQLQSYAETGRLNEQGKQTLTGLNQLIEEYQVSV